MVEKVSVMTSTNRQSPGKDVFQALEFEVAVFVRRAEVARMMRTIKPASANVGHDAHLVPSITNPIRSRLDRSAYLLLSYLSNEGPSTTGRLAELFQLDISTVSRQIGPLVQMGFVDKQASQEDKRVSLVKITLKGQEELDAVRMARRQLYVDLLDDWTDDERATFCSLLRRLNEKIQTARSPKSS